MSNPTGDDAQSAKNEEDREGESLCLKIKDQLEDLFSDSHLAEDGFLLKHVQKNKQGYVSLKLLTCLKKIKVLTKSWYVTLAGAVYSDVLEVNDECTKVRRKEPLPEWLLCSPTNKLLLVWNFSAENIEEDGTGQGLEHPSLSERIHKKFSAHGSVASVWILHPGKELPKELQCYAKRHKELGLCLCAAVKFDNLDVVRKAYSALKAEEKSSSEGMCVVPMGFLQKHHVTENKPTEKNNEDLFRGENPLGTWEDSVHEAPSSLVKVSDETPDTSQPQETSDHSTQRTSEEMSPICCSKSPTGLNWRYNRKRWCAVDDDKENSQCPWVLKRKVAANALNPTVAGHLNGLCLKQRVLRQPFGPDGTRGFQCREKPSQQEEE